MTLTLNLKQRIQLAAIIGSQAAGTIEQLAPLQRAYTLIRLYDNEIETIELKAEAGRVTWTAPAPDYGAATIELDRSDAKALGDLLRRAQVGIGEYETLVAVLDQINAGARP